MVWVAGIITGYLIGSLSFAYLVTKLVRGVDIRTIGTGNAGAANVSREVGKTLGIMVWFLDTAKGILAKAVNSTIHKFYSPRDEEDAGKGSD